MTETERWRTIAIAGHTGDVATAREAITDADPTVRELALGALHRLDGLQPSLLAAALIDPNASVRRRAATIAAHYPETPLLHVLSDPEPTVVEAAAWACGEHEQVTPEVLHALIGLVTDADVPLVREAAVAALGAIGDPLALPAILAACTDKPAVRRRAVLALAPFEGPEVDAAIAAALEDRDWQVRQSAEDIQR